MTENPTEPPVEEANVESPSQPPLTPETPPAEKAKAPNLKKPSASQRVSYGLFSRETRPGRFFRALLRTIAIIVILFALGAFTVFMLLYRPAAQELQAASQTATQTAGNALQTQGDLSTAQQAAKDAQAQAGQAKTQLDTAVTRVQVLRALNSVLTAKLALAQNNKTGAASALKDAQDGLQKIQAQLNRLDAKEFSTLQALFTLTSVDLDRDVKLAAQDLDRLQSELNRVDKLLPQ